jgi:hypothetical protein
MKKAVCKLGLALTLAMLAGGVLARTDGEKAVAGVGERLRANDCGGAVKALNTGLQAGYPEVALLAGTMFEGFAAAANGPDTAAALWWAKRARLDADFCTARLPATSDPDRFVEALRAWPARDLEVCNYVVGEMSFISAEARYPMAGIAREIAGRSEVVFTPARSHFESEARGATRPAQDGLAAVLTRAISMAGARYRKPEGIPPSWAVPFVLVIDTDKSRWW